jgi:hypothetical protein
VLEDDAPAAEVPMQILAKGKPAMFNAYRPRLGPGGGQFATAKTRRIQGTQNRKAASRI